MCDVQVTFCFQFLMLLCSLDLLGVGDVEGNGHDVDVDVVFFI